jgi:hypothetical protein
MQWKQFGSGFLGGLATKTLLAKLLNRAGDAVRGVYKTIVDATKEAFNAKVKDGSFEMSKQLTDDFKVYGSKYAINKWLKKYAPQHAYKGMLLQGHLYMFDYPDPLTKDKLAFYDLSPCVLSFGMYFAKTGNIVEYAVNLHMLPIKVRQDFMTDIFDLFKAKYKSTMYSNSPRPINQFNWQVLKTFVDKYHIEFAVRSYLPERRKNTIIFDYEDWGKAIMIPSKGYVGTNDKELAAMYKLHIRNLTIK